LLLDVSRRLSFAHFEGKPPLKEWSYVEITVATQKTTFWLRHALSESQSDNTGIDPALSTG